MSIGKALGGLVAIVGLAGCATGASTPQAPQVRYEHNETVAEGTMEDGTPAQIVQTAYGDATTLAVKEEMKIGGQVVGAMGWKRVEQGRVCQLEEVYLNEVNILGTYLPGETTFTDLTCDHKPDTVVVGGQTLTRGVDFAGDADGMDAAYQAIDDTVTAELNAQLRMQEWNAARGL